MAMLFTKKGKTKYLAHLGNGCIHLGRRIRNLDDCFTYPVSLGRFVAPFVLSISSRDFPKVVYHIHLRMCGKHIEYHFF